MLYRVAQIQLSMLSPSLSRVDPSLHTQCLTHASKETAYACVGPPTSLPNTDVHIPTQTETPSHPTNSAVLAVPTRTAFTFSVLASAMFVAARVTRPLVTPGAHPAVVTAAAARHTNAMATTVRCTNLCGRQGHRNRQKKEWGKTDRKEGRGLDVEWKGETSRWWDKVTRVKKRQIQVIVKERRPRSTTLSDGSWKEIPAPHKGQSFLTIQI